MKKNTSGGASTSLSPQQIVEETRHQILIKSNQAEQKLILRAAPLDLDSGEISYYHTSSKGGILCFNNPATQCTKA